MKQITGHTGLTGLLGSPVAQYLSYDAQHFFCASRTGLRLPCI